MVEVMKIMVTSFKRFRANTATLSAPDPTAGHCQPMPPQETRVQSLVWEDPLEKEMATHSSILAWEIPWTEEPGRL